jgi:cytosine/adenosine deaminase-related metal-dependent hydrolase
MADACRHLIVGATQPQGGSEWMPSWSAGLSPHAPYSVSRELFEETISLATGAGCPVAMHLAETREELEILAAGTGPLAELFATWGLWTPRQRAAFRSPLEVLQQLASLSRVLVIHGNYLTPIELDFLAGKDQFSVVYCPRTHAYFQHDRYPLTALLQRGIRVALGTDSRASNPDLSLLSEVRHVALQHPDVAPTTLIEMATRHGAEALGLGQSFGSIAPGLRAEFCVLPIDSRIRDPFEVVLTSPSEHS